MTEVEWLEYADTPMDMLDVIPESMKSERKWRLFLCACCRHVWHLLSDERSRNAVVVAERLADGAATAEEARAAEIEVRQVWSEACEPESRSQIAARAAQIAVGIDVPDWWQSAYFVTTFVAQAMSLAELSELCNLVRDIFGNPFQPTGIDRRWMKPGVLSLAQTIYDSRDFARLPALAEALEIAGCTSPEILGHCRQVDLHARGCWVLDHLLENR